MIDFLKFIFEILEKYLMPFQIIGVFEKGVVLTLGKSPRLVGPGLIFKIPFLQEVYTTPVMPDTIAPLPIHITTLCGKTVVVRVAVEYEIVDAEKWLIGVTDATTNLHDLVRGYTADHLTDIVWEEAIQKKTRTEIKAKLNKKCQELGCRINLLMFTEICQVKVILTSL